MTDVFISYKRRLRSRVDEIAAELRALGLDVWFDASLEAGSSFSAEISEQVRSAKCVLVCWSDDAFPHGGDRNGWVVGEATIGQNRARLVPVLLEPADLDPPWNTLQTEDLSGWSPSIAGHPGWRATLASIGRLVNRPELAAEDEARRSGPGYIRPTPIPRPSGPAVIIAGLAGAVITAVGAAVLSGLDPNLAGGYWELYGGVVLASLPLALLYWRAGRLTLLRAAGLVAAFAAAFGVGTALGLTVIQPLRDDPARNDLLEVIVCATGGFLGGGLSLAMFPLFGLAERTRRTVLRVVVSAVALAGVAAGVAVMPFFSLAVWNSAMIWLAAVWQLVYALLLGWVVRRSR